MTKSLLLSTFMIVCLVSGRAFGVNNARLMKHLKHGYLVVTNGAYSGSLGGFSGANSTCLSDLQANAFMGKTYAKLDSSHVFALICNGTSCQNLLPLTNYQFASSGFAAVGGTAFSTDASGMGPNNSYAWSDTTHFGGAYKWWSGRAAGGSQTVWSNTSDSNNCNAWTDGTSSFYGIVGDSSGADSTRWWNATSSTTKCSFNKKLLCIVNP